MNINKRRVFQSEDEDNPTNKNTCLKKITKEKKNYRARMYIR